MNNNMTNTLQKNSKANYVKKLNASNEAKRLEGKVNAYNNANRKNQLQNENLNINKANSINNKGGSGKNSRMTNELASKGVQSMGVPKPLADAAVNSKLGQKVIESAKKKNPTLNFLDKLTGGSRNEIEESASVGEGLNFKIPKKVIKWVIITSIPAFSIFVFIGLFMSASQIFFDTTILGGADSLNSVGPGADIEENKIDKKLENAYDSSKPTAFDYFIDENVYTLNFDKSPSMQNLSFIASTKYLKRKYSKEDLENLEQFFDIAANKGEEYNEDLLYDFLFKLYNLFIRYREKQNVHLDLPLLMATLNLQSSDLNEVFKSNLSDYNRNSKMDREKINKIFDEDFSYYKNWIDYETTEDKSEHDMEILAQNMVSEDDSGKCDKPVNGVCYKIDYDKYNEFLKEFIEKKYFLTGKTINSGTSGNNVSGSGNISVDGIYSDGSASMKPGIELTSEPDPSTAINYWKYIDSKDFVYPRDPQTGKSLGAWPKNYKTIPSQLNGVKTYQGVYIWPVTPTGGKYTFVYQHTGMDIMAKFGEPIYAPTDATLVYSTWGYTKNKGSDETSYSVTLTPDEKVNYNGVIVNEIFFTHMSGIIYRCERGQCNRKIKKGELLGFVGNAAGNSTSVGWAPHLHLTYYNSSNYNAGLKTTIMENFYNIKSNTNIVAGG